MALALTDVALIRRRQELLSRLRATTGASLARIWAALPAWTADEEARFANLAGPVLTAAQLRAIDLQIAYLERALGEPVDFDPDAILAASAVDLRAPFIALAGALAAGAEFADALLSGSARASGIGESGVQWASRAANGAVDGHDRIGGWTRTLSPSACDWCVEVADQTYRTADTASFGHLRCDCGVDPIVDGADPGSVLNGEILAELDSSPGATP